MSMRAIFRVMLTRHSSQKRTTAAEVIAIASKRRNTIVIASALVGAGTTEKTMGATIAPSVSMPPSHSASATIVATCVASVMTFFIENRSEERRVGKEG